MGSHVADFDVRRVAIIGAGPSGLASARYLQAQGSFTSIVVFERQSEVGGIWNYSDAVSGSCPVPQTDAFWPCDAPVRRDADPGAGADAPPVVYTSPMYEKLHANIPRAVMRFSDQDFAPEARLFPSRELIQQYLVEYAEAVRPLIRFSQRVDRLSLVEQDGREKWVVEAESTAAGNVVATKETFDAVIVANGHYATPFIPDIKNGAEFNQRWPGVVSHSRQYRSPRPFKTQRVLVVGNGPSGLDIALQINAESEKTVLLSGRNPTPPERLAHSGCQDVPEIDEFLVEQRGVRFKDGQVETDIDAVIFCTGFLYGYPFLKDLGSKFLSTGRGVHGLYQHLISIQHPTIAFSSLPIKAAPWPVCESQAALLAALWSNNLSLPPRADMVAWESALAEKRGDALHVLDPLEDGHYINELHDWIMTAQRVAKKPPRWDEELMWQRQIFLDAKARFEQEGCTAMTLAELGFHYVPGVLDS